MITSCPTQSTAQEQQSLTELFNLSLWVCLRLCSFFHTFYIIDKLKCNSLHHLFSLALQQKGDIQQLKLI